LEDYASVGDQEAVNKLTQASEIYLHYRQHQQKQQDHPIGALIGLFSNESILHLVFWQPRTIDQEILEQLMEILNSITRRGPHPLQLPLDVAMQFVTSLWLNGLLIKQGGSGGSSSAGQLLGSVPLGTNLEQLEQTCRVVDTMTQMVLVYGKGRRAWQGDAMEARDAHGKLAPLLTRLCMDFVSGLGANGPQGALQALEQEPVVTTSYFRLLDQVLETSQELWGCLDPEVMQALCSMCALSPLLNDRFSLLAVIKCLTKLASMSSEHQQQQQQQETGGIGGVEAIRAAYKVMEVSLTEAVISGIGGAIPRSRLPQLAELFFAMVKHHMTSMTVLLRQLLLERTGYPSQNVSEANKREFIDTVL
ncbi:hypothetical protein EV182_006547, partial [Spiromyces aspiralis]